MSGNIFGKAFRVVTFGESHGPYIGCVIDGVKPGLPIDLGEIQKELNRRRPGQSAVTTPRQEKDRVQIVSGVLNGKTTGTPICMLIKNEDQRSRDYRTLEKLLRPGHASYTYIRKYGVFDYRGGGRASGRETATRVAAGAVARQFLKARGIEIIGYTREVGGIVARKTDFAAIEKNPLRAPDLQAAAEMEKAVLTAKQAGDSLGGTVEVVVKNCPPGLGEPVFNKLEADLAAALMSIGAVKGFEIGSGFRAARMKGSQHNDPFYYDSEKQQFRTRTNHAGGVLGGISTGMDIVMRIAVKPPSSIRKKMPTVDWNGQPVEFGVEGRHDPCICPRVVPVAEAMVALVLIDHLLLQERLQQQSDLSALRDQIDTIDTQLLLLLAQRFYLVEKIARFKKEQAGQVKDHRRENLMRENWQQLAEILELPLEMVESLRQTLLTFSRRKQEQIINE